MLSVGLFGPIYAIFVSNIGGDVFEAGSAYAAFSLAAGFMIFFISRWEDHVKHKEKLILISHVIGAVGILGYMFVQNPIQLFLVQILLGLAGAIGSPAFDGLYSRYLDKGRFVSEWGLFNSINYVVAAVSAVAGGLIVTIYNFQVLFMVMFLFSLASIVVSVRLYHLNK